MILTDYFLAERLSAAKHRYDVTASTGGYDLLESLLINKRSFNVGGLSYYLVPQPQSYSGRKADFVISKGSYSISKVFRPNITSPVGYGDINGTHDACIFHFNDDFKEKGITAIELFIARGSKSDRTGLYHMYMEGELSAEIEALRMNATPLDVLEKC
jgi:hypothetical protein